MEDAIWGILNMLSRKDWDALVYSSTSDWRWRELDWWHNKYYLYNSPNDGRKVQRPKKGAPEIPYERELFYPSAQSRFSLGAEGNVAYFSNDFVINCCETIEQFSDNSQLMLEDFLQYGGGNPTPGWFGYPLCFHLTSDSVVLDLSSINSCFFKLIGSAAKQIWEIITDRNQAAKQTTQQIANAALVAGFDGIVYTSVRAMVDVVMPEENLVVFKKLAIKSA